MAIDESLKKLTKIFDQDVEITGTLEVGGNNVLTTTSVAGGITSTDIANWNTAYGWGNHADAGYLTSVPAINLQNVTDNGNSTDNSIIISNAVPLYFTNTGTGTYNKGVFYSNTTDGFLFEAPWETDATTTRVPFILTWRGGMGHGGIKLNGDTQLHTNSTGLGIDVTSPSAKLHIADGNNYARLGDLRGLSTMVLELQDGTNPIQLEAYGDNFRVYTGGSHRFTIDSGGDSYIESTNRLYFNNTNAGIWGDGQDLRLFANDDIYIDAPYIRAFNASTEYWRFDQASGATGYSWINVGYLGIGKAAPDDKLDVNGVIRSSSSSAGDYVRLYGGSGTAQWDIYGNGENLRFSENSGGGGCVTIDDKLGIGTSGFGSTAAKFLVGGYLSDGSSAVAQLNGFVRIKQELIIHDASDISKEAHLVYDGTNGLYFTPTNGSGNFGIGTTTPDTHLDVSSGTHTKLRVQTTGVADASVEILGYDAGVHIGDPTNGNRWAIWNDGVSTTSKLGFGSYALGTWYTDGAQVMTLTHDGNVGIGMPSPTDTIGYGRALDIGSSTGAAIYVRDNDNPTTQYGFFAYDGNDNGLKIHNANTSGFLRFDTSGTERLRIDAQGNIGLGVGTSPTTPLLTNSGRGNLTVNGSADAIVTLGINGTWYGYYYATSSDLYLAHNGGNIQLQAGGSTKMHIDADGSVGINTTNPIGGKLHVQSSTGVFESPTAGSSVIDGNTHAIIVGPTRNRTATANTYYGGVAFNHLLNYNGGTSFNPHPQAWIGLRLYDTPGSERSNLVFATKEGTSTGSSDVPIERMTIDPFGKVGIGISTPFTKTHIYDTFDPDDAYGYLLVENGTGSAAGAATNAAVNIKNYHGTSQFMQWESYGLRFGSRITANGGTGNVYITTGSDGVAMLLKSDGSVQSPYVMLGRVGGQDNTIEFVNGIGSSSYIGGHINYHGGGNLSLCSGGGVVGIGTTATTGSARLVVGNYLSAGSSAIAQLDGFVRLKHGVLIHNDSNTSTASYIAYENDGLKLKTEGAGSDKVTIGSSAPGAYNQLLNLHRASGTTGIQMTTGSAYSYITNDGTWLNFASDAGSTGVKFKIHRNAPDDSAYINSSGMGYHYFLQLGVPSITGGQNTNQSIYIPYGGEYFTMGYKASARSGEAMHRTPISGAAFYIEAGSTEAGGICLDQDSVNVYGSSDGGSTFRVIDKDADVVTFEMLQTSWNGVFRGDVIAYGSMSSISDRRIKENIEPYENILDKLCSLGVYSYNKITLPEHKRDRKEIGVIAQEVEAVFPELVNEEKVDKPQDANGLEQIKTVDYEHLTAILLQSIKELRNEVKELKAMIK